MGYCGGRGFPAQGTVCRCQAWTELGAPPEQLGGCATGRLLRVGHASQVDQHIGRICCHWGHWPFGCHKIHPASTVGGITGRKHFPSPGQDPQSSSCPPGETPDGLLWTGPGAWRLPEVCAQGPSRRGQRGLRKGGCKGLLAGLWLSPGSPPHPQSPKSGCHFRGLELGGRPLLPRPTPSGLTSRAQNPVEPHRSSQASPARE